MDELLRLLEKNKEKDIDLDHISRYSNTNSSEIPILHPEIFEVHDFYCGGAVPNNWSSADCQINVEQLQSFDAINRFQSLVRPPGALPNNWWSTDCEINVKQLLSPDNKKRFQCLFGPPGVGKTTLSKRLVTLSPHKLSIHLKFSEMNYHDSLTLQELLFSKKATNLGFAAEKCEKAFSWILANQSKCLLVLDGLDQAQFELKEEPAAEDHNARLSVSTIIACLFKKTFLPQVRIITTSRPQALLSLHHSLRPNNLYQLQGLSQKNTSTLLRYFAGDRFEKMSQKFTQLGAKLEDLCRCPLILQMFYLSQAKPSRSIGKAITLTKIFATVLENFQHSKHNRGKFQNVEVKLARLACNTFIHNKIMISWAEVKEEGLDENEIHDLLIVIPGYEGISFQILDIEKKLYFSHQLFHEYYCAWHVCKMADEDFLRFLQKTKDNRKFDEVYRFLFGLVYDVNKNQGKLLLVAK